MGNNPDNIAVVQQNVIEDWVQIIFKATIGMNLIGGAALSQTAVSIQNVDGTGHFDLVSVTGTSRTINGGSLTISDPNRVPYFLRIREEELGEVLTVDGDWIDMRNFVGTAQRPYYLKGRRRFRANTAIIMEFDLGPHMVTEYSIETDIEVVFNGIKVRI